MGVRCQAIKYIDIMKQLKHMIESLLSTDFDIKDESVCGELIYRVIASGWKYGISRYRDIDKVLGHKLGMNMAEFFSDLGTTNITTFGSDKIESELDKGNYVLILRSLGAKLAVQFVWKDKKGINVFPGYLIKNHITFKTFWEYKSWILNNEIKFGPRVWLLQRCIALLPEAGEYVVKNLIDQ